MTRREPRETPLSHRTGITAEMRQLWSIRLGLISLLVGVSLLVAWLTNPAIGGQSLPQGEDQIGKVATTDIRAPVSFTVPDEEATERKRKEAEDSIRSVYDFESELGQQRIRRLREAFGVMTAAINEPGSGDAQAPAEGEEQPKAPETKPLPGGERNPPPAARTDEQLRERLMQHRSEFVRLLQMTVTEDDFRVLVEDAFSPRTLDALVLLLDRTMQHMIVASRELLSAYRNLGITVRRLKNGVVSEEESVSSFTKILDLEEARLRLEQTAAMELGDLPKGLRRTVLRLAESQLASNLTFNREVTEKRKSLARLSVQPLVIRIQKGAMIIRDGDVIERRHIMVFRQMQNLTEQRQATERLLGTALLVAALLLVVLRFARHGLPAFSFLPRNLLFLGGVLLMLVVTVKIGHWVLGAVWERFQAFPLDSMELAIPFAAGAMLVRFVLSLEAALMFSLVASPLCGLLMQNGLAGSLFCLAGSLVAIWSVASARQRASLFRAGAMTGLANVVFALVLAIMAGFWFDVRLVFDTLFAFSGGILSAMVVMTSAPLAEAIFGYTTDVKLMELANLNHPLLKDLIVQAPGSYHHSIIVGSLVEAAAEAIHCNPLQARVMAYYHDIGKIKNPQYFSENQRDGSNPHDKLKASLSATILKAHVRDGAELARTNKLGQPIVDAISQHHGRSLMKFFYQRAKEQDPGSPVNEEDFRYPGPKPQSREVALVMLADSVEAAARSVSDPSPARLQGLVQNMINRVFADGQMDECDLTLKDLHEIARAFNRVLVGIYHRRPDYPEAAVKERETPEKRARSVNDRPARREGEKESGAEAPEEDLKRLGM